MRLTDIPIIARNQLPGPIKLQIPLSSEADILSEMMAVGVGLSAAVAVMWVMSHQDLPLLTREQELIEPGVERALKFTGEQLDAMRDLVPDISLSDLMKILKFTA